MKIEIDPNLRKGSKEYKRAIIEAIGLTGHEDFHELRQSDLFKIHAAARAYGYQKPKMASGSRARYFWRYLTR